VSQTPILDGEQPLPTRKVHWVLALLLGFAIGGVFIALDRARGSPGHLIPPQGFPLFVVALYIAIFVHELGHLIAGITAGFELRTFMVGAFLFKKESTGWRFRFVLRNLFWGGLTAATPRYEDDLVNRYTRVVLGGPTASVVLLILTFLLPGGLLIRLLFWVNLLFTVSVCIPHTVACLPNDAKLILLLTRKGVSGERVVASLHLLALDAQGKQPREWPPELIEKLHVTTLEVTTKDESRMPVALSFLLSDAAEKGDAQRAAEILERALAINNKMLPDVRRGFMAAASFYHGFHLNDAALAEKWLKQARSVKSGSSQKDWDFGALAAVAFAAGDHAKSAEFLAGYIALLDRQPMSGMILAERERMAALMNTLTARA
jgi:hypothetical protein